MNALLVVSAYLSPLVDRLNFANGMSVFLVLAVGWPIFGVVVLLVSLLHIPTHSLFWLAVTVLAFWFEEYAKRFAQSHKVEIVARSHAWPRTRAVDLFLLSFLLFGGLVKTAAWIDG